MGKIFVSPTVLCMRRQPPSLDSLLASIFESLPERQSCPARREQSCRQSCDATRGRKCILQGPCSLFRLPWFSAVQIGQFRPSEITIKIERGSVIIHARREERNGEDVDITERHRVVKLPEGVDSKRVRCCIGRDGRLCVIASFLVPQPEEKTCCEKPCSQQSAQTQQSEEKAKETPVTEDGKTEGGELNDDKGTTQEETLHLTTEEQQGEPEQDETTGDDSDTDAGFEIPSMNTLTEEICQNPDEDIVYKQPATPTENGDIVDKTEQRNGDTEVEKISTGEGSDLRILKTLEDSIRRTDDGLHTRFEVSLNMENFDPENISIKFIDNELCIDAEQEDKVEGVQSLRKVHRKYTIPEDGALDAARANVNSSGIVNVIVPLQSTKDSARTIPIVQLSE